MVFARNEEAKKLLQETGRRWKRNTARWSRARHRRIGRVRFQPRRVGPFSRARGAGKSVYAPRHHPLPSGEARAEAIARRADAGNGRRHRSACNLVRRLPDRGRQALRRADRSDQARGAACLRAAFFASRHEKGDAVHFAAAGRFWAVDEGAVEFGKAFPVAAVYDRRYRNQPLISASALGFNAASSAEASSQLSLSLSSFSVWACSSRLSRTAALAS